MTSWGMLVCLGEANRNTLWGSGVGRHAQLFRDSCKHCYTSMGGREGALLHIFRFFKGRDISLSALEALGRMG